MRSLVRIADPNDDPEVSLTVREPEKVPATVGGAAEDESGGEEPAADAATAPAPTESEGDPQP